MMPGLDGIYNREFFMQWGPSNRPYVETARYIAGVLQRMLTPRRLVDLGCGCGVYAEAFRTHGVEVVAVDGVVPPPDHAFPGPVEVRDLTVPFSNPWGVFDAALCLEVGEHIPEKLCDVFLANITQFSGRLVLSCAPPFQGGHHHVNEQPKRYWRERLVRYGFAYDRERTGVFSETFKADRPPLMWMCQQVSFYDRDDCHTLRPSSVG